MERELEKISTYEGDNTSKFTWPLQLVGGFLSGELKAIQLFEQSLHAVGRKPSDDKSKFELALNWRKIIYDKKSPSLTETTVQLQEVQR